MLVLVIPQIETLLFLFNMRLHIVPDVPGVSEGLKKSKTFCFSVLVEARAGQDTCSCMPPTLKMPHRKWEGSLFFSALLHNFTLVKVRGMPHKVNLFYIL